MDDYFHLTVKLWNSLEENIRNSDSLSSFKKLLQSILYKKYNSNFLPHLYLLNPPGKDAVNLARLRMGLSALNSHRFKYSAAANRSCPNCNNPNETTCPFLFDCPAYAAPRFSLLESLRLILPPKYCKFT